jgi:hypothetical protein
MTAKRRPVAAIAEDLRRVVSGKGRPTIERVVIDESDGWLARDAAIVVTFVGSGLPPFRTARYTARDAERLLDELRTDRPDA